jgi:hypothetical protein
VISRDLRALSAEPVISHDLHSSSTEPVINPDLRAPLAGLANNRDPHALPAEPVVNYDLRALPVGVELEEVLGADVDHDDLEPFPSLPETLNDELPMPATPSLSPNLLSSTGETVQQQLFSETRRLTPTPVDSHPFPYASNLPSLLPHPQSRQGGEHSAAPEVPRSTFQCKFRGCLRSFTQRYDLQSVFPSAAHIAMR